ncbi:His-Xaa-Ser system radical SAM maturase HxsC [Novisyntrophococcus fermenticellae]|uniref:His-Xaa-Ser system radical SAM maturase HxsC n=1 Tax=Novisyntrophococcus fermenticellae TaxID=2068655 RepID=UPI001E4AF989|nr:His-Xaa-Ser system radical SAM maturase HxsC [Novisyntrophococcus fermenticellae]
MECYLRNYHLGYRQGFVNRGNFVTDQAGEVITIRDHKIVFGSDQTVFEPDSRAYDRISECNDGDIVNISENGEFYRQFNAFEGDATIFMGGNCNSNCTMCPSSNYERHQKYSNNSDELLNFIDMLPQNLPHFVVTGGEPTMKKELFLEVMDRLAVRIPTAEALLLTNGRSFSARPFLEQMLIKCPPHLLVAVPVHGSCPGVHDAVTRSEGSFNQTMKGIHNLLTYRIAVEIRIVVTKMNCDDLLNVAKLICKDFLNVFCVNFISLEVRGNCVRNKEKVYIDAHASFQKSKHAIDYLIQHGIDVGLYNYPLCCVERGYWFLCKKSISPEKVRYTDACERCAAKEYCGGMFVSTLKSMHFCVTPIEFRPSGRSR